MDPNPMRGPTPRPPRRPHDVVALILAGAVGISLVLMTAAMVYEAATSDELLSEGAARLLGAIFAGVFGILGAYIGSRRDD